MKETEKKVENEKVVKVEIKIPKLTIQDAIELDLPKHIKNVVLRDIINAAVKEATEKAAIVVEWGRSWGYSWGRSIVVQ